MEARWRYSVRTFRLSTTTSHPNSSSAFTMCFCALTSAGVCAERRPSMVNGCSHTYTLIPAGGGEGGEGTAWGSAVVGSYGGRLRWREWWLGRRCGGMALLLLTTTASISHYSPFSFTEPGLPQPSTVAGLARVHNNGQRSSAWRAVGPSWQYLRIKYQFSEILKLMKINNVYMCFLCCW